MTPTPPSTKKIKKTGPIRTGLVLGLSLFFILFVGYFYFLFDGHLRTAMEWLGTKANGAEVNISSLKTSFSKLSLQIGKVEVTNALNPALNLAEFDEFLFQMEMDAILRGKILIKEASLIGVRFGSARKKVGRVLPPDPPAVQSSEPSPIMKAVISEQDAWKKKELEKSILSDVIEILQADDLKEGLGNMLGQLQSEKLVDELLGGWKDKRTEWDNKFKSLKNTKELQLVYDEARAIKPAKDPKLLLEQVKQVQALRNKAKDQYGNYKKNYDALAQDVKLYQSKVSSIPNLIQQDIADVKSKMKVPNLDVKNSGKDVFNKVVMQYLGPYVPYIEKARPYWEAKNEAKSSRPKPKKRGEGVTVLFPITKGYPTFWLQKMKISSDARGSDGYALAGEIRNVTTHPKVTNMPTELLLKGDLRSMDILGIDAKMILDLRENFSLNAAAAINSFPLQEFILADSKSVTLGLNTAKAGLNLGAQIDGGNVDLKAKFDVSPTKWLVQSEKPKVQESVQQILNDLGAFYILASLKGQWSKADLDIDTNFIDKFFAGIKLELDRKINEIKVKIEEQIHQRIKGKQDQLAKNVSGDQKELVAPLTAFDSKQGDLLNGFDQVEQDLEKKLKEQGKEKAKETFGKELDKLKKKVKLPF